MIKLKSKQFPKVTIALHLLSFNLKAKAKEHRKNSKLPSSQASTCWTTQPSFHLDLQLQESEDNTVCETVEILGTLFLEQWLVTQFISRQDMKRTN